MFEDFVSALRNFKTNRTRTILSLLGIIIGVASVIMVTTIGLSATGDVRRILGQAGLDLVQVRSGWGRGSSNTVELNEGFREELAASISGIKKIIYTNEFSGTLRSGGLEINIGLFAVEPDYFSVMGMTLDYGRFFSVSENAVGAQKIVLGSEVVRYLFPEGEAAGRTVILQMDNYRLGFQVAGVLAESDAVGFAGPNQSAFVPIALYKRKINPANRNAENVLVQALNQNEAPRIQREIDALGERLSGGNAQALSLFSMQSVLEQYNQVTRTMNFLLTGIAGISLLVGGIGIMNIMIVTVTERKREIGIRKALGASPAAIRTQFLVESAALTLMGGAAGIALGIALSAVTVSFFGWILVIDPLNCSAAFVFSAAVGLFFGIHPAIRAAKLDPVEALAGE
ncbi:MAG: ABC transporter permease [Treponema sp.]|nr:ABC transporter permease [Treponema sp.]